MSNPAWFAQHRARGVCYVCRRPMADHDPRLAHRECQALLGQGWRAIDIRVRPPTLGPVRPMRGGKRTRRHG